MLPWSLGVKILALALIVTIEVCAVPSLTLKADQNSFRARIQKIQLTEYNAAKPKSVAELQQFRETQQLDLSAAQYGAAELINLNPEVNSWFLLNLQAAQNGNSAAYHLENAQPLEQQLVLDPSYLAGLVIFSGGAASYCPLWGAGTVSVLEKARKSGSPYVPLCGNRLLLRNQAEGHQSTEEWVAGILRDHVWDGEKVISFVKSNFYQDAFLETADFSSSAGSLVQNSEPAALGPLPPENDPAQAERVITPSELGIDLEGAPGGKIQVGRWYQARQIPGVFISAETADLAAESVKGAVRREIAPLDSVESKALVYMTAFDLNAYDAGYELGTDHPGVGWSDRIPDAMRDDRLPGPDGIGTIAPLAATGMLKPTLAPLVVGAFTSGFKRHHGAFRYGDLSNVNSGSHYGFISEGVVLSKLQPGLATFLAYADGTVDLQTWQSADDANLEHLRYARQNGVPLIEQDQISGKSHPGAYVKKWKLGNWSGAQDLSQRTLRAGLCLQESDDGRSRYLIYGYFSSATPSAMALVFQAYHCQYAMHLDMNALEHTYLSVYRREGGQFFVENLIKGMSVLDKVEQGQIVPRFVGFPDNRDFFYLIKKTNS